jgi:hypothetical protein
MKLAALVIVGPFLFTFMLGFAFGLIAAETPWRAPKGRARHD